MKQKISVKDLVKKIKDVKKTEQPRGNMRIDIDYTKPQVRVRDMRQESIDMGAHGSDIWKEEGIGND